MRKSTVGLLAFVAGAGAMYLLDSRYGPQRRAQLGERLQRSWDAAKAQAQQRGSEWLGRAREALQLQGGSPSGRDMVDEADGLEPLSMTPEPLERRQGRGSALPTALAVAAPVVLAVGAAWWKRDDGSSLH